MTRTGRAAAYAAGVTFIAIGLGGLVANAADTHPPGWALWFAGGVLVHDIVLVPVVLGVAVLVGRLPVAVRRPVRGVLVVAACVTAVGLPFALGLGRRPDNPSLLPLPYAENLIKIVVVITGAGAALATLSAYGKAMGRMILTILGILLSIWLLFTVLGMVFAALKVLLWVGLIAVAAAIVVTLVSKASKSK